MGQKKLQIARGEAEEQLELRKEGGEFLLGVDHVIQLFKVKKWSGTLVVPLVALVAVPPQTDKAKHEPDKTDNKKQGQIQ